MAPGYDRDTKVRVIAVYRAIMRGKPITAGEIKRELQDKFGITCDRKTVYSDIAAINRFVPIRIATGRGGGYSLWDVIGEVNEDGKQEGKSLLDLR